MVAMERTGFFEEELDWPFEALRDSHHHIRADQRLRQEDPKDVIKEKATQKNATDLYMHARQPTTKPTPACNCAIDLARCAVASQARAAGLELTWKEPRLMSSMPVTARPIAMTLFAAQCSSRSEPPARDHLHHPRR